jgi:choline dehydrogenase-like flavoprotein
MDHVLLSADGVGPALSQDVQSQEDGRCVYLPRFDSREMAIPGPARGFGLQLYQLPAGGGRIFIIAVSFAEMVPRRENKVLLDSSVKDAWGIPALRIECKHSNAELMRAREQKMALEVLFELIGARVNKIDEAPAPPGTAVHECGTARMGDDPTNSVLDPNNQCWDASGLYVTDGACFPTQGSQNPTLTILALTARACSHAVSNVGRKS